MVSTTYIDELNSSGNAVGTHKLYMYPMSVRKVTKNNLMSFEKPLQGSSPESSFYHLERLKTMFKVKAYLKASDMDINGFSDQTIEHYTNTQYGVEFNLDGDSMKGYIKQLVYIDKAGSSKANINGTMTDVNTIEFTFVVGTSLKV